MFDTEDTIVLLQAAINITSLEFRLRLSQSLSCQQDFEVVFLPTLIIQTFQIIMIFSPQIVTNFWGRSTIYMRLLLAD